MVYQSPDTYEGDNPTEDEIKLGAIMLSAPITYQRVTTPQRMKQPTYKGLSRSISQAHMAEGTLTQESFIRCPLWL